MSLNYPVFTVRRLCTVKDTGFLLILFRFIIIVNKFLTLYNFSVTLIGLYCSYSITQL